MRPKHLIKHLACISLVSLLSACATPDDGYYDANGNWVAYNRYAHENHPPLPGGTHPPAREVTRTYDNGDQVVTTTTTYRLDRRGYYDRNGYYIATDSGFSVPSNMFPPRGMCRVWFPDRAPADQPIIESCDGIQYRLPSGAYVIYGG